MAEVDTTQLSQEHGAIRHDLAVESARLSAQVGGESCATNKHIGDMRQEDAENFGHTRRDIQGTAGDIRRDVVGEAALARQAVWQTSGDSRREQAEIGAASAYQNATQHGGIVDAVKTAAWHNSDRTGTEADRIVAQDTAYFIAGQGQNFSNATALAALKASTDASFSQTLAAIQLSTAQSTAASTLAGSQAAAAALEGAKNSAATALEGAKTAAAVALAAEKIATAQALASANISRDIFQDGDKTRALVNDLKYHDLNRALVERNAELVEEREGRRHWRGMADQNQFGAQFAQLQSMMQNFNSQLADTRQGMVNFGSMAGVGQTSTSNNVR